MGSSTRNPFKGVPLWLICVCRWFWNKRSLFWGTVVFGLGCNILATLLFYSWPWSNNPNVAEKGSFVKWLLQNPDFILAFFLTSCLLTAIAFVGSRFHGERLMPKEDVKERKLPHVQASGERSVAIGGNITGSTIITGDNRAGERERKGES